MSEKGKSGSAKKYGLPLCYYRSMLREKNKFSNIDSSKYFWVKGKQMGKGPNWILKTSESSVNPQPRKKKGVSPTPQASIGTRGGSSPSSGEKKFKELTQNPATRGKKEKCGHINITNSHDRE